MTHGYQYSFINNEKQVNPAFNAEKKILKRPVQEVQTVIETGVDSFRDTKKQDEKRRKFKEI